MKYTVRCGKKHTVKIDRRSSFSDLVKVEVGRNNYVVAIKETSDDGKIKTLIINNKVYPVEVKITNDGFPHTVFLAGIPYDVNIEKIESTRYHPPSPKKEVSDEVRAGLPGQICAILTEVGTLVQKGQNLLILESMKMENEILAPKKGIVKKIHVKKGELVMKGHVMIEIK